jgi:hypothetical protein
MPESRASRTTASAKAVEILNRIDARVPVDLVVRTPQEVRQRLAWNDFFLRDMIDRGKVLYEAGEALGQLRGATLG